MTTALKPALSGTEASTEESADMAGPRTETAEKVVVLADARTPFEREEVARWASRTHPGAAVLDAGASAVRGLPEWTVVVPARVAWLPPARGGERRPSWGDLVALTNPRRPRARAQRRIARRHPDRVMVVAGEPAAVGQLRLRHAATETASPFEEFVGRQAVLACERSEIAVIGNRYKVPRLVAEQVTASAGFQQKARDLAVELGRPEEEVMAEATDRLSEMASVQSRVVVDLFARVNRVFHERAWTIKADLDTLEGLRELNKSHALVFLPSHRTYLDPAILADVLTANDFPRNHTLGGDNMSFWPMGTIARRSGVVYIRRKFGDDRIYRLAARAYLSFLVGRRFNLEWYLEGGRSRTGKLRPPMLGLLAYLVDALEDQPGQDVMLVPTSIVYDHLAEIQTMAAEDGGGTKKPESLGWMLRYARAHRTDLGTAHVRFAQPISLREALQQTGDSDNRVEKVAFQVMDGINRATPVTSTSLAGFALLGEKPRAYTRTQVERILEPMLGYIDGRGLPGPDPAQCRGDGLVRTLDVLTDKGVLARYDGGEETVWSVTPENHSVAAYYRNGAIHHFVNRAITELTLLGVTTRGDQAPEERVQAAVTDALRLRDLLKFEFYFPGKRQFFDELVDELDLISPAWRELSGTPSDATEALCGERLLLARRTLQPFLDAQLVVAEQLVGLGTQEYDQAGFLAHALAVGRQLLLQGRISTAESVSRELYTNALKLAAHRGLLGSGPAALSGRAALLAEVREVRARLSTIATLEGSR
jgi:glycerol-3-phosphate O-acyltransferase